MKSITIILLGFTLCLLSCGKKDESKSVPNADPQVKNGNFIASESFISQMLSLDSTPREDCLIKMAKFIATQIPLSGNQNIASAIDQKLTLEIKETCKIKRI